METKRQGSQHKRPLNKTKTRPIWHMVLLWGLLCIVSVITIIATTYDNENYSYLYDYGPYYYEAYSYYSGDAPYQYYYQDYHHGRDSGYYHGYYYSNQQGYDNYYYQGYAGHDYYYNYNYDVYMNDAPQYVHDYTVDYDYSYLEMIYNGTVSITVHDDYSVQVYPYHAEYSSTIEIGYEITILVKIEAICHTADINLTLPYGWTYTIGRGGPSVPRRQTWGVESTVDFGTIVELPYAYVRVFPIAQPIATSGYMGIAPLVIGADRVVDVHTNATPGATNGLVQAIAAAPTNAPAGQYWIIAVSEDITMGSNITIDAGRRIILASYGTDLSTNTSITPRRTLSRNATGRQFRVTGDSTLILSNIVICAVNRSNYGGGVFVGDTSRLYMEENSVIQHGRALSTGPNAVERGGGNVLVMGHAVFTMNGGIIRNGASNNSDGAGVAIVQHIGTDRPRFIMNDGIIYNNRAFGGVGRAGGVTSHGVFQTINPPAEYALFIMNGGYIINNSANNNMSGGADARHYGRIIINGGTIAYNVAEARFTELNNTGGGGGVGLLNGAIFTMYGGYIRNNTSYSHGGGVFVRGSIFNMHGGEISTNFAGWRGGGGVVMERGRIDLNEPAPEFNFYGGTIRDNRTAFVNMQGIADTTRPFGGGVRIYAGHFSVRGNDPKHISDNHTTFSGGGIAWLAGTFTMEPGASNFHVTGNSAGLSGGGIYSVAGNLTLNDGAFINNNRADVSGGGIFISGGTLALQGAHVNNNGYYGYGLVPPPGTIGTNFFMGQVHWHPI